MKIAILNAPVITVAGDYTYKRISISAAKRLLNNNEFISYCGHESTASLMSRLLNIKIPVSRRNLRQKVGQKALIFRLKERAPEGIVYSEKDLHGYGWTRIYAFHLRLRI